MPFLTANGGDIYYETIGNRENPALVLLHAGVATLRMWDAQAEDLGSDHFVLRFDSRGYGRTTSDESAYREHDDTIALLDDLGIRSATLVGASRGGMIAVNTALEHPDRVAGVVTIGSGIEGFPATAFTPEELVCFEQVAALKAADDTAAAKEVERRLWAFGLNRRAEELDPDFVALVAELDRPNLERAAERLTALPLEPSAYSRLETLRAPVLVTVGDFDVSRMNIIARALVQTLPQADAAHFAHSAHLPSVEEPAEFLRVLRNWLGRHAL